MSGIFVLEPHQDDAALFSCFNALREQAKVITVLRSFVQEARGDGITAEQREQESERAMKILGLEWEQWPFRDDAPDWGSVYDRIVALNPDRLYVPAHEIGGHEHHNDLCKTAFSAVGSDKVISYLTYTRAGKSKWGLPVEYETHWVALKMQALICYGSQLEHPLQVEHFLRSWREYVAP